MKSTQRRHHPGRAADARRPAFTAGFVSLIWATFAAAGLTLLVPSAASAEDAPEAVAPANTAQDALERAQRLADNPMRHILRASQFQRRSADVVVQPAAVASPGPVLLTLTAPWDASMLPATRAAALNPQTLVQPLSLPAPQDWPSLPGLPEQDPLVPEPEVPQLQTMVEPALDIRLRDQLGSLEPVDAVLTLRIDGSVAAVAFPGNVDLRLRRVVQRALAQWRYAPLRTAQEHRVRLEFPEQR